MATGLFLFLGALVLPAGCSSSSGSGGGGTCPDLSGTWSLSGSCADTLCTLAQSGCSATLHCQPSGDTLTGTVGSATLAFGNDTSSCSASVSGKSASGSCTESGMSCQFTANCVSGACAQGNGTGGSGGSGNVSCTTACAQIVACCSGIDQPSCMQGCAAALGVPACAACFGNPSCSALGPCVIANCGVPQNDCPS